MEEAAESNLVPGYALDRYELLCPLATGGMATVWLARLRGKRGFEKLFAIKTIRAELSDDPHFEEMFLDEAHIAAGIQHPNVANILDLGEKEGVLYLVMEWVDGESLAKVRKFAAKAGAKIPLGLALRIIADACAGLHAAHELKDDAGRELGVVHRDVSPQNILIATNGAVKVIDFGIAKAENRAAPKTRTGIVKGKLQYMAPEQARATQGPIDRRVDLWALGACLYELISDQLPFDGENQLEILTKVTGTDPAPPIPGVPPAVREILDHSLARDPAERFATAAAMRRAIENAIGDLGLSSTSDDVAAFVETYLPDRAARRKELVTRALKDAAQREESGPAIAGARDMPAKGPTTSGTMEVALDSRGRPVSTPARGGASSLTPRPGTPASRGPSPARPVLSAREILERPSADPQLGNAISAEFAASAGIPRAGAGKRLLALLLVAAAGGAAYVYFVRPNRVWSALYPPAPSSAAAVTTAPSMTPSAAPAPEPTLVVPPPAASSSGQPVSSAEANAPAASASGGIPDAGSSHVEPPESPGGHPQTAESLGGHPQTAESLGGHPQTAESLGGHPQTPAGRGPFHLTAPTSTHPLPAFSALAEPEIPQIIRTTPTASAPPHTRDPETGENN